MSVKYDDYKKMANRISYWILKNNKKIKTRKEYSLSGKKANYDTVKKTILKNQNTNNGWGRKFLEAAVIDNKDTSQFPNYVTYNNKQYDKAKYIYMAKYVTSWWKTHDKAPSTVPTEKAKSTSKSTLKPYLTSKGCSGMGQCTSYNCACNSLQQCFYRLTGILVDESTIAKWAGTTTSGTGHDGINTAVAMFNKKYGKKVKITWYNFNDLGKNDTERWKKFNEFIEKHAMFCHLLYRLEYGHYEVPKLVKNSTLDILNSLGDKCTSTAYCGYIESRTKSEQLAYIKGISQKSIAVLTI